MPQETSSISMPDRNRASRKDKNFTSFGRVAGWNAFIERKKAILEFSCRKSVNFE